MSSFMLRRAVPSTSRVVSSRAASTYAKLQVIGRLGDTPEVTVTAAGKEMIKYAIATNSGKADKERTNWWNVVAFLEEGPQRAYITSLGKGALVSLEAEASFSTFQDGDGKERKVLSLLHKRLDVLQNGRVREESS